MKIPRVWSEPFTHHISDSLRAEAARRFRTFQLPASSSEWQKERRRLADMIWDRLGVALDHDLPLDTRVTGEIKMDGYKIKNIYYQSRPGIYVTGNLYIPGGKGPFPGVVNMHGHWSQGRLAERVQSRGHALAKSGYVCLCVDAWGSGERSTVHGEFEYHGGNLGGSLMDLGETLMGAQVVDNMRAVDLLSSLDIVDASRLGATGASGGGNQTMWLAALDDRIAAAVPVVSVGSFESYVGRSNCVCELLPWGLTFTEESGVLALTAPRALKICNCLGDCNPTFHPSEMLRSFREARKVYQAAGADGKLSYQAFNHPHGYWPEIREAMLGWFDLHLKGEGHGAPRAEPPFETLPEEKLMVFKKGKRDPRVASIQEHCRRSGAEIGRRTASGASSFSADVKRKELRGLLGISKWLELEDAREYSPEDGWRKFSLETTCGRMIPLLVKTPFGKCSGLELFAHPSCKSKIPVDEIDGALKAGRAVALMDLWGAGETAHEEFVVVAHHTLSRGALWLGRPMLGEWAKDLDLAVSFLAGKFKPGKISVFGCQEAGVAALFFNALKEGASKVTLFEAPVSYRQGGKPSGDFYSMAAHLPGVLPWGDIPLAAALGRGDVEFASPRTIDGARLTGKELSARKKEFAGICKSVKSKVLIKI